MLNTQRRKWFFLYTIKLIKRCLQLSQISEVSFITDTKVLPKYESTSLIPICSYFKSMYHLYMHVSTLFKFLKRYLRGVCLKAWSSPGIFRISCKFRYDLIFAFLGISFKSQNIDYAEIIICIIFYKKSYKIEKIDWRKLKILHNFPIFANFVTQEKNGYTVHYF